MRWGSDRDDDRANPANTHMDGAREGMQEGAGGHADGAREGVRMGHADGAQRNMREHADGVGEGTQMRRERACNRAHKGAQMVYRWRTRERKRTHGWGTRGRERSHGWGARGRTDGARGGAQMELVDRVRWAGQRETRQCPCRRHFPHPLLWLRS
jgi:hypothetical protein